MEHENISGFYGFSKQTSLIVMFQIFNGQFKGMWVSRQILSGLGIICRRAYMLLNCYNNYLNIFLSNGEKNETTSKLGNPFF